MLSPIAFVSRTTKADEEEWISALSAAMPLENIISINSMTEGQRNEVEIAIVANPDPSDLEKLPRLKWIHSLWAGVERLVAELGTQAPPIVRLTDPELTRVMAESVLAWTYYLQRDMPAYRQQQQQKIWKELEYRHPQDVTAGVIGLGVLGAASAQRLGDAGFNVIGWSRSPKTIEGVNTSDGDAGLEYLLENSDIVVCLVPLTAETTGLIDATRLARMKHRSSIINFARGAVVVSGDLLNALDEGRLSHAVLDVFEKEPLDASSPFWMHPKVTVIPHISGPTSRKTSAAIVVRNIDNWRRTGELPTTVDIVRGY